MTLSIREAFGKELVKIGKKNKKIVAVSCDLKDACKLSFFLTNFQKDLLRLELLKQMQLE